MLKWIKLIGKVGRLAYELVDELRIESRVNREIEAQFRRIQSQRYQEASHMAGHEVSKNPVDKKGSY